MTFYEELQALNLFHPIDFAFGKRLSKSDNGYLFLAYLMYASRQGHLAVEIKEEGLEPFLLPPDMNLRAKKGIEELDEALFSGPLVRKGSFIYLKRNDFFESRLEKALFSIFLHVCDPLPFSRSDKLNDEQQKAVEKAMKSPFLILSGGPGRGKTFTAKEIIREFIKAKPEGKVLLAAPTGKAAMRLSESTGEEAKTLHNLLDVKSARDTFKAFHKIQADLLIIDEASMIDVRLFSLLLASIGPKTRLILMGDDDQLPPVEAGTLLTEITHFVKKYHPDSYVHLSKCMRSDQEKILNFAEAIRLGDREKSVFLAKKLNMSPLNYILSDKLAQNFPSFTLNPPDPDFELAKLKKLGILTPLREGLFGSKTWSEKILKKKLSFSKGSGFLCIPILITRSNPSLNLYNGELGVLIRYLDHKDAPLSLKDQAYFEGNRNFPALILPPFEPAYALSIHKSQGSEFDEVILLIPEGAESFGREVLYTGVTRARKELSLYGEEKTLKTLVSKHLKKKSGLTYRLSYGSCYSRLNLK
ncbi:MAG: AAA family ATPase [Simkaniaceae bacterium]